MYGKSVKAYQTNTLEADLSVADPHRVIQLMMQGILERLSQAKGAIDRKDFAKKSETISGAMALINGLQDSLDLSRGEIPENLFALYDYMKMRLLDASSKLDKSAIDEVATLLITIKSGWEQIPEEEKQKAFALQQQQGRQA